MLIDQYVNCNFVQSPEDLIYSSLLWKFINCFKNYMGKEGPTRDNV